MTRVAIIGCGFVGNALKAGLRDNVEIFEIDPKFETKISDLKDYNPDLVFICVPTPMINNADQDLDILKSVIEELRTNGIESLTILKSTVLPNYVEDISNKISKFVYNPEFLREKHANEDFINSKLIVFGGNELYTKKASNFYKDFSLCKTTDYIHTDLITASLIKYSINSFLATKVSFFNELNLLFQQTNTKETWVDFISYLQRDNRIGTSHMSVPGHDGKKGFGGACLPKDSFAFYKYAQNKDINLSLIKRAIDINNKIRQKYNADEREINQNINFNIHKDS